MRTAISPSRQTQVIIYCLLLVAVTLAFYNPIVHNQFTGFDDWSYILKNQQIQSGLTWNTVKWSFTTFKEGNWHPLTWLSHALDYQIFHLDPVGHHYTNLLFHAANVVLLFLLLVSATKRLWPSLTVAALFALHPINVESIAWAAERKNVLSTLFFLLALHAYDRYARTQSFSTVAASSRPKAARSRLYLYLAVIGFFVLGLLAKPQIVTFPFVLLLWDYWPLNRIAFTSASELPLTGVASQASTTNWRHLIVEKLPLFILAAVDSTITMFAQRAGNAVRTISEVPVAQRFSDVPVSYVRYLGKLVWPSRLAPLYPRAMGSAPVWQVAGAVAVLLLLTGLTLRYARRRYLMMGWLWFLGTLVPMIGIVTVGDQAIADRYAYISYIGLFIAIVWGLEESASAAKLPLVWRVAPALAVLLIFGGLTSRQVKFWHDDETLWRYTLRVTENNYVAHNNLALMYSTAGQSEQAIGEFRAARSLHRYPPNQVLSLASYELQHGHPREAMEECRSVVAMTADPRIIGMAWAGIGQANLEMRNYEEATQAFRKSLRLLPDNSVALVGSGILDMREGRADEAVSRLVSAVSSDASDVNFLLLAQALLRDGRVADANRALAEAKRVSYDLHSAQTTAGQIIAIAEIAPIEE